MQESCADRVVAVAQESLQSYSLSIPLTRHIETFETDPYVQIMVPFKPPKDRLTLVVEDGDLCSFYSPCPISLGVHRSLETPEEHFGQTVTKQTMAE